MILSSTNDIIRVVTSSTADIHVQASWADITSSSFTPDRTNTAITSATTTTIVASPAASTQRQVKTLSIYNAHASSPNTVTVQHYDGTTSVTVYEVTLAAGERAQYDGQEWPGAASSGTGITDGDKGDITVASSGAVWTIDTPSSVTVATDDKVLIKDTSNSDTFARVSAQSIRDLSPTGTAVSAYRNTTQSIGSGSFTKIQMNTENFDAGNTFDNATNYRLTPTIAGKYFISLTATLTAAGTAAGQFVICAIYKNGSSVLTNLTVNVTAGNSIAASCNGFFDANGTDYFEFYFYNSGSATTIAAGAGTTFFGSCLMEKS